LVIKKCLLNSTLLKTKKNGNLVRNKIEQAYSILEMNVVGLVARAVSTT
jgi:hypothetical protein